jgi:hypothetical protein
MEWPDQVWIDFDTGVNERRLTSRLLSFLQAAGTEPNIACVTTNAISIANCHAKPAPDFVLLQP